MSLVLTDEQQDFVSAVRDFAARECGTREQRDALTDNGTEPHNDGLYKKAAALGWLRAATDEECGRPGGGMVDLYLFLEETSYGQVPIGSFAVTSIVAGAYERFGT